MFDTVWNVQYNAWSNLWDAKPNATTTFIFDSRSTRKVQYSARSDPWDAKRNATTTICNKQRIKKNMKSHLQRAADPTMIPPWTDQSATRSFAEATFPALEMYFAWKNTAFRLPATSQKKNHPRLHLPRKVTLQHHSNFTKYGAGHEKLHCNFTKYYAGHKKLHCNFAKCCAGHEKLHSHFTTGFSLDWTIPWLNDSLTELFLDWTIHSLTELLLDWTIDLFH